MHDLAAKRVEAGDVGQLGLREPAGRVDHVARDDVAGGRAHAPDLARLVERRVEHARAEPQVRAQAVVIDAVVRVGLDLGPGANTRDQFGFCANENE